MYHVLYSESPLGAKSIIFNSLKNELEIFMYFKITGTIS